MLLDSTATPVRSGFCLAHLKELLRIYLTRVWLEHFGWIGSDIFLRDYGEIDIYHGKAHLRKSIGCI